MDPLLLPLAQASAACYADGAVFDWESPSKLAHLIVSRVAGTITFALAGTEDIREWILRDLLAAQVPVEGDPDLGDVHAGFLLDAEAMVQQFIWPYVSARGFPPYFLTGHSKGGGDGQIVLGMMKEQGHPPLSSRFFEPPMAGGYMLAADLGTEDIIWTQTFNTDGRDIITTIRSLPTFKPLPMPPLALRVPDTDDWATKHRIPAVLAALTALS